MSEIVPFEPRSLGAHSGYQGYPPSPEGYPERAGETLGAKHYLAILRRQWWLVAISVALFLGAAAYVVFRAPPIYKAEAVIRLNDARRAMTGGEEANAYDDVLGRDADILLSQIQIMTSRQIATDVVDKEGLRLAPLMGQPFVGEIDSVQVSNDARPDTVHLQFGPASWSLAADGQNATGTYGQPVSAGGVTLIVGRKPRAPAVSYKVISRSDAVADIRKNFSATPRPKTDVIDVAYVSPDPDFAQRVANAVVVVFQQHNADVAQQASRRRRIFLEEQLRQTDVMLQRAMGDYSAFRSGQKVFSSKEKASAQEMGIVDVDMRRADLNAQRRTYQQLLSGPSTGGADGNLKALVSSPGIAANPVIQQLYGQLSRYEDARDSLTSSGAAQTNPDVIRVNGLVSQATGRLTAAVRNQIQALDAQIDALDNLKQISTAQIASAPQTETEEARLAQQVQAVQKISDQLQEDFQKAKMSEAVEAGQVQVVDMADVPSEPISAGKYRKLALGLIIGLIFGIGGAILRDGMNTSIRRRDDVERLLQVPGLAIIPKFVGMNPGALKRMLPGKVNGNGSKNGKIAGRASGLVTIHDAKSSGAEAYRTLRTNIIFSQAVQTLHSIVVTSASPAEGKTTTAANLAVSFAQQGMRVLLIDCDLRRSRVHKMFGLEREPGLTECVLGRLDTDAAPRETQVTGLYVLPSGQLPPNPSELLGGEKMRKTLIAFTEAFDLVVLDTPPLLAASDAAILATIADGVVLVVRAGVTEADAGQQAMAQLTAVGARVVGAVLNDPDAKVPKYGGYYKYEYAAET